jgi:hypothetical protein
MDHQMVLVKLTALPSDGFFLLEEIAPVSPSPPASGRSFSSLFDWPEYLNLLY